MIKKVDFHLPGGRNGVLLIHGLTGTPTEMRFVAKGLNRNGFTVHGMQLAGHCGDAADLLGNPWPSLAEFYRLSFRVRQQLKSVRTPCLVVHAQDDDVASLKNVRMVVRGVSGPVETVLLENSYHMITVDQERSQVIERTTRFFNEVAHSR